jgi:hypothetical protein
MGGMLSKISVDLFHSVSKAVVDQYQGVLFLKVTDLCNLDRYQILKVAFSCLVRLQ